jgi:hypothetical protein
MENELPLQHHGLESYHPSFAPNAHHIRERGALSPYLLVAYEPPDGMNHVHQISVAGQDMFKRTRSAFDDIGSLNGAAYEEMAGDLTEDLILALRECESRKGPKHGRQHRFSDREVWRNVLHQLQTREPDREWAHLEWLIAGDRIWNGHVPAAVLMPVDINAEDWSLLMPGYDHMPNIYSLRDMDLPAPRDVPGVKADPIFGTRVDRRYREHNIERRHA